MDAIEAVKVTVLSAGRIPVAFYAQFYKGKPGGLGPWVWKVNQEVEARYSLKLVKVRGEDAYEVATPERHLARAHRHGIKALRQKQRQVSSYDSLVSRADAPEDLKAVASAKRDKAAASLSDMNTAQRKRARIAALLEGK